MADNDELARGLSDDLKLSIPPIAISFTDEVPAGVRSHDGNAPAGCSFWEQAAQGAFTTSTSDHELCAIGVHTHNMADPSTSYSDELGDVLKVMADLDYVTEDEVATIPVLNRKSKHVVYAPLGEAPLPADVVLLFADARQSLVITEAVQRIQGGAPHAMGRPACAAVPQAINSGQATLSLGCCGARAYLDALSDDVALWAVPGSQIGRFAKELASLAQANRTLTSFHDRRRQDVEAGSKPSIKESLARIGAN